jgi:hypothetical protein
MIKMNRKNIENNVEYLKNLNDFGNIRLRMNF